ncbi:MAG: diguanylate cyclase domain-containing protein [Terriglobia bacterium]
MAITLDKHLERAEKALSKNKTEQAITEFEAAHKLAPRNAEIIRYLGDLYTRVKKAERANHYYGLLFDRYFELNDVTKAVPLYRKNLLEAQQPPERVFRYAALLHRQSKSSEAVATYQQAAELFEQAGQEAGALQCVEKLATLEPENAEVQVRLAELAQKAGKAELAAKAYLRAGQLVRPDDLARALGLFEQACGISPGDRTILLNFSQAHLSGGNAVQAIELLMPLYAESTQDQAILATLGEALLAEKRLKDAEEVIEVFYQAQPDTYDKLFELADLHCKAGQAEEAVRILGKLKERLGKARRQRDFVERLDTLYHLNETVRPLAEFAAQAFNEANQEARYCEVLGNLFGLDVRAKEYNRAADALERLIDVDPYDFENQKRLESLQGKIDAARYRGTAARIGSAGTVTGQAAVFGKAEEPSAGEEIPTGDPRKMQNLLEDLIVQVEIFLQYSLQAKAVEKLQRIAQVFPGEEAKNERLRSLYEKAQYFPKGYAPAAGEEAAGTAAAPAAAVAPPATMSAESVSDLAKITEITHALYRQGNPKNVVYTAVSEIGKYLHASRCLGVLGRTGAPPTTAVEYCALGTPQSPGPVVMKLLRMLAQHDYLAAGSLVLEEDLTPELSQVGAKSILAAPLVDKEKQEQVGVLVVQQGDLVRKWKPNEIYLLQAVADQAIIAVNHTRLRTLMKTMGVADETTGLLSRGNYLDCLVSEATRAKSQGTPLAVALLEIDKGGQLMRQHGEAAVQNFLQQAGEAVLSNLRQSDIAVKYTAIALALVLPDTTVEKAKGVVEKMRKVLGSVKLPDRKHTATFSFGLSEAKVRPDFDVYDTVTDVINRAEFSLEAARKKGNTVAVL